jgi:two-component system, OmpR family, sensor kinase
LVAATLVLVACGLLASGIAVTSIMRHSLISRIDQTLLDASRSWAQAPWRIPPIPLEGPNPARPPSNFYVRGIGPDGRMWMAVNDREAEPALPADNDVGPVPVTVGSVDNSKVEWRAMTVRGPRGELTTVAIDLFEVQSTVRALIWSQAGIGAAVLLVLGIAGFAVVHRSLRPLVEVERTAAAIAAGQLDRRVPERDPHTEVGRLSLALNGMLAQIQRAVAASELSADQARVSEERMRRFITDASHELRTPLTTIRGFAELYRQGAARDVEMLMSRVESESTRSGRWNGTASICFPWPATPCTTRSRSRPNAASRWRCSTGPAPRRCSATMRGSGRCWATWWPMHCSTPRKPPASRCGSAPTATAPSSRSATKGPG